MYLLISIHAALVGLAAAATLGFIAARRESKGHLQVARALGLAAGLIVLGILIRRGVQLEALPVVSRFDAHLIAGALIIFLAIAIDLLRSLPIVTIAALPLAFSSLVFAAAIGIPATSPAADSLARSPMANVHVVLILLAYAAFEIAFVTSILYLIEHRQLKSREEPSILGMMPSLETSYRLTRRALLIGVILLTAGAVLGYQQGRQHLSGSSWRTDAVILTTTAAWVFYLTIMGLSFVPSFKGRRTAIAAAACFVLVMTMSWATAFWSGFHRNF